MTTPFAEALKDLKSIHTPIDPTSVLPPRPTFDDMSLIDGKVKHRIFGIGKIIDIAYDHITVEFQTKTCDFIYPDAFEAHIKLEDDMLQQSITKYITDCKDYIKLLKKEFMRRRIF